jgi:SnoaL-like domain
MTLSASDRMEIVDLVTRADAMATRRDADGYVGLFTDDPILDGAEGTHRGTESLRDDVGAIWRSEGDVSVHLTLNVEVQELEDQIDLASANSVLVILGDAGATTIRSVSLIEQIIVRNGGVWRISRRSVRPIDSLAGP